MQADATYAHEDAEQARIVIALFQELLDLDHAARQQRLALIADAEIAKRLRVMLAIDEQSTNQQGRELLQPLAKLPNQLGAFTLKEVIGTGGMGIVVRGVRTLERGEQQVAIKIVASAVVQTAVRERFLRERALLARLQHAGIAALIDVGETAEGLLWYAMELIHGRTLVEYSKEEKLDPEVCLQLIAELADVLHYAHTHGVIHRDVKPQNVMVDDERRLKLIDFGIAKELDEETQLTIPGSSPMTPRYAAPEQRAYLTATTASDQWQCAALALALLGSDAHAQSWAETKKLEHAAIAPDLRAVLKKALREDPAERYGSMAEFASDLRAGLERRPVQARQQERWYESKKFIARNKWSFAIASIALVLLSLTTVRAVLAERKAIEQARIAERSQTLMAEIFLIEGLDKNLTQMTLQQLIANGVDRVIADKELPVQKRIALLETITNRSSELRDQQTLERGMREMLRLSQSEFGADDVRTIRTRLALALALVSTLKRVEAAAEIEAHISSAQRFLKPANTTEAEAGLMAMRARAFQKIYAGDAKGAVAQAQQMVGMAETWFQDTPLEIAVAKRTLAVMHEGSNDTVNAIQAFQEVARFAHNHKPENQSLKRFTQWDQVQACGLLHRVSPDNGVRYCTTIIEDLTRMDQLETEQGSDALNGLAASLGKLDRNEEALTIYRKAEQIILKREGAGTQSLALATVQRRIAKRLVQLKRAPEAIAPYEQALAIAEKELGVDHQHVQEVKTELAEALAAAKR